MMEKITKLLHDGEHMLHIAYCGLIYMEGHGLYAVAGGALGVVVAINFLSDLMESQ